MSHSRKRWAIWGQTGTTTNNCSLQCDARYEPTRPILRNISFTVAPGTTCAIVGSTGSGKSTIMRMLFRFYDVDSGSIVIDGQDIANCTLESVRGIMGVVPQDTVLFHDTIRYNVRYGRMDAADTEVDDAARGAEILESISTFPNGFDTIVGEVSFMRLCEASLSRY